MSIRKLSFLSLAVGAVGFGLMATPSASASVIYDNLSPASGAISEGASGVAIAPTDHGPFGDSFSTSSAALLTDVKLLLDDATPADGGTFTVSLYSNSSNAPGSPLDTLGTSPDSNLGTALAPFDVPVGIPYPLTPSTRYWIEVQGTVGSGAKWSSESTSVGTGVAGEYQYYNGASHSNSIFTPYQAEVTVIPEPASLGVFAVATAGVLVRRRRIASRRAAIGAGTAVNAITTDQRGMPRTTPSDLRAYQTGKSGAVRRRRAP